MYLNGDLPASMDADLDFINLPVDSLEGNVFKNKPFALAYRKLKHPTSDGIILLEKCVISEIFRKNCVERLAIEMSKMNACWKHSPPKRRSHSIWAQFFHMVVIFLSSLKKNSSKE